MLGFKMFRAIPDANYLQLKYKLIMGRKLNLKNPKTFNEKLQWLKLNDRRAEYTMLVDKYEVRQYIKETIGEEYLIPLLGVYNNFDEIDFDVLPNKFVLKPNHTSGDVFICRDKSKINYRELKSEVDKWLQREYYWLHREWPYKNVKPKIVCEKYMVDESGVDLKDYKFMSFNGEVRCSFVGLNRQSETGLNIDFYDLEWKLMPFERHYPNSGIKLEKPQNYKKMIEFAELLSRELPFVRVDFYEINGKVYFGELTFYPGSGFEEFTPESYDELLGSWIDLKK
ncbi:glycosyl transferase [Bacillus thuringiensis]|nr:glycosyl transferase [Bacillus thuringiensis]PED25965.1 glycosyl transferase [Bacillus thuringiensis]PFL08156.1 glycosyl transferase [Bacillus thuringiensis]PGU40501.1 glycosyl transferase [Bacillus thuringiensis]